MVTTPRTGSSSEAQDRWAIADLIQGLDAILWEADAHTLQFLFVSQGAERLLGYPAEKWLSESNFWIDRIHPDDRERTLALCREAIPQGRNYQLEYRMMAADGRSVWLRDAVRVVCDRKDRPQKLRGVMMDITEQKHAEHSWLEHEARLRAIAESIDEIVFETDGDGTYLNIWTANEGLLMRPKSELLGHRVGEILGEENVGEFLSVQRRVLQTGRSESVEYPLELPDRKHWFLARVSPIRTRDGSFRTLCVSTRDITDRKRAEESLRESEEKFSEAFRSCPDAILIGALEDGRILDVNESFLRLTGYQREEVIGKGTAELNLWINPREGAQFVALLRRDGEAREIEIRFRTKSGQIRSALESAQLIELRGAQCILATVRDITERKALEEQLRQAQKMEAVGRLAGGVAHDFNNLLVGILGYSDLLRKKMAPDNPLYHMVSNIHSAAFRGRDLTGRLLALSRKQLLRPKVFDLNELVLRTDRLLRRVVGENIDLVTESAPK